MTTLYSSNFDAATVGSIAPGWANLNGSWAVQSMQPVSGDNAFGSVNKQQGNQVIYTGVAARADMGINATRKAGATLYTMGYMVRATADGLNSYIVIVGPAATAGKLNVSVYSNIGGYVDVIASQDTAVDWASGDTLHTRVEAIGTALKVYLWRNAEAQPASATYSLTISSWSGYAGLFHHAISQAVTVDDIDVDDGAPTVTTYATLTGPASGTVGVASSNFNVTLSATNAAATTITLSDGGGGGSFAPSSLSIAAGATTGTFTYTPNSAGAKSVSITANNGYTVAGSPIGYAASNPVTATAVTLSGASSGSTGAGVTLTATLNGTLGAATSVTFADSGAGTFSPNPVTIAAGETSGTTTFTPTASGAHSISIGNNRALSNAGSPLAFTASSNAGNIPVDDPGLYWSPYNWDTLNVGTFGVTVKSKQTTCCGAYLKFNASGTASVALTVDATLLNGFGSTNTPVLAYSIKSGPVQTVQLPAGGSSNITLATGLSGTSSVEVWVLASDELSGERFGLPSASPSNAVRINQIVLDAGGTVSLPALRPKRAVFFGDSIVEGVRSGRNTTYPGDHKRSAAWQVCRAMNAEYGVIGYGAQGWELAGDGYVPQFVSAWNWHSDSRPRSFAEPVDYCFVMLGFNGGAVAATVSSWIASARAALGASAWIFIVNPPSGRSAAAMIAGVASYNSAHPSDARVASIDYSDVLPTAGFDNYPSQTQWCIDGVHPDEAANSVIAAAVVSKAQAALAAVASAGGVYPTASQVLTGVTFGPSGADYTGTVTQPAAGNVRSGIGYGAGGAQYSGTLALPAAADVRSGTQYGSGGTQYTGTLTVSSGGTFPAAAQVLAGVAFGPNGNDYSGTIALPAASSVLAGVSFGAGGNQYTGTVTQPTVGNVRSGIQFGVAGTQYTGNMTLPAAGDVRSGVSFGTSGTQYAGNLTLPSAGDVRSGTQYGTAGTQYTGTLVATGGSGTYPTASQVISGVSYGPTGADYTGNVTLPSASQVQAGVGYGAAGTQYVGLLSTGGGVVVAGQVPNGRYLRVGA